MTRRECLDRDRLRVRFRRALKGFRFDGNGYGPYKKNDSDILPKKAATKLIKAKIACIDLEQMSIRDILACFSVKDFQTYFDHNRILAYFRSKVREFEEIGKKRKICPSCGDAMIPKFVCKNGSLREHKYCSVCRPPKNGGLLDSRIDDWVIASSFQCIFQGKLTNEVEQTLMTEANNRRLDFGINDKLPARSTLLENPRRIADKLEQFHKLMILIIGGVDCKRLQIDDLFEHRKKRKVPKGLFGTKKRKRGGFYYCIHSYDEDHRFTIDIHVSENRNKSAYGVALMNIKELLRPGSLVICRGDKLAAMEEAAKNHLPGVVLDFQKRPYYFKEDKEKKKPFYDKGPCIIIERKNRDIRKTLRKRQRNQRLLPLKTRALIAKIGGNYLRPYYPEDLTEKWEARPYSPDEVRTMRAAQKSKREAAKQLRETTHRSLRKSVSNPSGRSGAQMVGIPYPFDPWNWRLLLMWVDWVHINATKILKKGLR